MGISDVILSQLIVILTSDKMLFKVVSLLIISVFVLSKNKETINYKNLVMFLCVLVFNIIMSINDAYIDFIYFSVFSLIIYICKWNIKINDYLSLYLIVMIVQGVVYLCLNL